MVKSPISKCSNQNDREVIWILCITDLMCGPVRNEATGKVEQIVVAGGYGGTRLNTVEIYDIAGNTWQTGEFSCCI